jgi:hypothetical protein
MRTVTQRLTDFRRTVGKLTALGTACQGSANRQTCRDGILLNTMPKSGSVYMQRSLAKILNGRTLDVGNRYALIDQIGLRDARALISGGCVAQSHLAPSLENLQILQHYKLKVVLHLRDPRQALLSWVHHIDWVAGGSDADEHLLYCTPRPPAAYFAFSLARKIDWQIENYLPQLVAWLTRWMAVVDLKTIPILITHQDALRTDERVLFDTILAFHQLHVDYALPNLPRTLADTHFRRADPTEWQRTFTREQAMRATALIPLSLRQRFGWGDPQANAPAHVA